MTARNCWLTITLLFSIIFQVKAQEEENAPEDIPAATAEVAYDHKIIAILPLKTNPFKFKPKKDSLPICFIVYITFRNFRA